MSEENKLHRNHESIKKRGVSLRRLNIIMIASAIIISVILIVAMQRTQELYNRTHSMTQNLLEWRENSYDLQKGSDYLTEEARRFVITGDKQHIDNYFEEVNVTKRRDNALSKLEQNNEDSPAVKELSMAMDESVRLMDREYYAFRLAIEGYGYNINEYPEEIRVVQLSDEDMQLDNNQKINAATMYLFDDEYTESKMRISDNTNDCLDRLEYEVDSQQQKVSKELGAQVFIEHVLTFLLIGIMLGIVILTSVLVFKPLRDCVDIIRREEEIPLSGAYEVRFLAKNYNLMYYTTKENQSKLNYDANHDNLTGLFNRRGYDFFLNNVDMETSSLLIIDLDNFKNVNDTYGHDVGDKVIANAASVILNSFRSQDYVCRLGGDEFAVIMIRADSSMKKLIENKIDLINQKLAKPEDESIPSVSCSVGAAFGRYEMPVSELFKRADKALYQTKENGRNGISFYEN